MLTFRSASAAMGAVIVSAMVGGFFGRSALATQDPLADHYRVFTSALAAVQANYVETVDSERLVYGAINGMLQTLDPHSSFLEPKAYAQMRERQQGTYYGLGISILVIDGDITVSSLFEGSPAHRKGLRRGDVIARITGESAKGWTSDMAVQKLRGPKGTTVNISIRRPGYDQLLDLTIERDEINIPTILGAFMIDAKTGYIRLRDFSETTDRDLGRSLQDLRAKGMKRLVLDLRDNPGGPLDQAIKVSNRFLPKRSLIVYTRGRVPNSDQDYRATEESDYHKDLGLVVLTNRNSASAAEIVAGAIQDHDRGLIVGETTFGKALVQSVYRISQDAGLALTTARYYTPSGRLIQRPWDGTFDDYLTYSLRDQTENREHAKENLKYTDSGRQVWGGGGIEPDKFVPGPLEGFNPSKFGRAVYARQAFPRYAERFAAEGDTRLVGEVKNRKIVAKGFEVDTAMLDDFKAFVKADGLTIDEEAFAKDREFIKAMIKYEVDLALFSIQEARKNLIGADPQARFAMSVFADAEKLTELARAKAASRQ
jgi:carboxyl-terminal processing protease